MIKGFILAAGLSKRLRPITEHIPKPLLPIAGEVLLDYVYRLLKNWGIDEIGINLHYKADQIKDYIEINNLALRLFYEKEILNTGGAIYNARNFLSDSFFVVHNADIYWDGNIWEAVNEHLDLNNSITLITHDYPKDNKLIIDRDRNFKGFIGENKLSLNSTTLTAVAYTGIAIYSPHVLDLLTSEPSSITELWLKAKEKGFDIKTYPAKYNFWYDIGTPEGFANAVFDKLRRNFTSMYVHPSSTGCELITLSGKVVIEKDVKIKKSFKAKNVIILPETEVIPNTDYIEDSIICGKYFVPIPWNEAKIEKLTQGGSSRNYIRKASRVLCYFNDVDDEFHRTVNIGNFLRKKGFPVPEIFEVNFENKSIIFEDLGDLTLYSWLKCRRNNYEIIEIYKKIIENIAFLHWKISNEAKDLLSNLPQFDFDYFKWESNYFIKECVEGVFDIKISDFPIQFTDRLEKELNIIAQKLSESERVLLHRDLQSQNIMLKEGNVYFIDYQSARWGPPSYDLASLLWDPYTKISNEIRKELIDFYIEKSKVLHPLPEKIKPQIIFDDLAFCRIQRHMQALGAYGFLSLKKGKRNFLQFIPSAINMLIEDLEDCKQELEALKGLVKRLKIYKI